MFSIVGLDHLVLRVRELDSMLAFYCGALGCTVERRQNQLGLVQLRAGSSLIDLVPIDGKLGRMGGAAPGREARNLDHFCLRIEPFNEAQIRRQLAAHGVQAGPVKSRYGAEGAGPSIYLDDPEGNVVELKGPPAAAENAPPPMSTMPRTAPITDANPSIEEMEARVARFRHLMPTHDYVDAGIPGCERTTLRVLGQQPGAPLAAEGFHMNIVRCEPGKAAPLHNHLTQEVFVALTGRWEVFWGPQGDRHITLEPWDTVSVPPGVSRGFRNVSAETAWLMGMASGEDPGMINWPEQVRAVALAAGIALP